MLAAWLDVMNLLWCHVPNGGARNLITGRRLKAEGVKRGVPDVLIFTVPKPLKASGVAIELKRLRGGIVTQEQKDWHTALKKVGWQVHVARGAVDAIDWLKTLGYGRP